jgi:hypothetical protein
VQAVGYGQHAALYETHFASENTFTSKPKGGGKAASHFIPVWVGFFPSGLDFWNVIFLNWTFAGAPTARKKLEELRSDRRRDAEASPEREPTARPGRGERNEATGGRKGNRVVVPPDAS